MTAEAGFAKRVNLAEIIKVVVLSLVWLTIIFGAVWLACWLVGIVIPALFVNNQTDWARVVVSACQLLTPILAVMVFIPINAMFMVLIERRALALFTVRLGPNRVGPDGYLQTFADALKLLFKEDITPRGADAAMFTLAPIIFFAPSIFGGLPLLAAVTNNHELFQITNLSTGIFYVLAASSVPVVGIVMGGWASNNKYSLVGGLRSAAQAISYEIPLVLSLVTVCVMAGTLDVVEISNQQAGGFLNWNICGGGALRGLNAYIEAIIAGKPTAAGILQACYPYGFLSAIASVILAFCMIVMFAMYLTAACAEINRIPFDLPEAESELVSGYNTEYSGIKFAIFFLAEFTNLFIVASIAAVMFLGAGDAFVPRWLGPYLGGPIIAAIVTQVASGVNGILGGLFTALAGIFGQTGEVKAPLLDAPTLFAALAVIVKVYLIVFVAILVRGTLPRFRIDQLMDFGWKRLIPITLACFLIVVFAREFVKTNVGI